MSTARGAWGVFLVGRCGPSSDSGEACAGDWLCVQGVGGAGQKTSRLFHSPALLLFELPILSPLLKVFNHSVRSSFSHSNIQTDLQTFIWDLPCSIC